MRLELTEKRVKNMQIELAERKEKLKVGEERESPIKEVKELHHVRGGEAPVDPDSVPAGDDQPGAAEGV